MDQSKFKTELQESYDILWKAYYYGDPDDEQKESLIRIINLIDETLER